MWVPSAWGMITLAETSVNRIALDILKRILSSPRTVGAEIVKLQNGATIIDLGVRAHGSFEAGRLVTEICLGGLGTAQLTMMTFDDLTLPAIMVTTDWPAVSTLGCQAGYPLLESAGGILSGPARALAMKPRELYEDIGYRDRSDAAVINLEGDSLPSEHEARLIADECKVEPSYLYVLVTPGESIAGVTQVAGRAIEDVTFTMHEILHYDVKKVKHAFGIAPIAPVCADGLSPKALPDDLLSYGGKVFLTLDAEPEEDVQELAEKLVFESTPIYGRNFHELMRQAHCDMSKIPGFPDLFRPAEVAINDMRNGRIQRAGKADAEMVRNCLRIA
jgi:methenyltetrahydromethanopterin cyclohydrolase